ncbi:hypothetical protein DMENIID0001_117860 [Sergentomyia squamirostris]
MQREQRILKITNSSQLTNDLHSNRIGFPFLFFTNRLPTQRGLIDGGNHESVKHPLFQSTSLPIDSHKIDNRTFKLEE